MFIGCRSGASIPTFFNRYIFKVFLMFYKQNYVHKYVVDKPSWKIARFSFEMRTNYVIVINVVHAYLVNFKNSALI